MAESIRRTVKDLVTIEGQSSVATMEVALKRRSPTYELKFGLIGFAVGLSALAGVALAQNIHHRARFGLDTPPGAASAWSTEIRR